MNQTITATINLLETESIVCVTASRIQRKTIIAHIVPMVIMLHLAPITALLSTIVQRGNT
jgi:hypothetical protein